MYKPEIAYAVGIISRFADLEEDHWKAVKNILKYLRKTKDIFLVYGGSELKLEGITDSSFQSGPIDCKSILGYVFTLNSSAMS